MDHAAHQYRLDCMDISPRMMKLLSAKVIKGIDGAVIFGIPIRELSRTELMALVVMLAQREATLLGMREKEV